ncbi:hypothetical protein EYC80_007824 [Monilinia laxa]|uniref:Uncharacterized protein n=1 Tax=Monilinia laxa TaxID=61186 RepID=A0A5N6JSN2_MONLA|nr:hypothetical protein EYC80_007824 [Monilinia laxa]
MVGGTPRWSGHFFNVFPFLACVNTVLIPALLISRDCPSSVSPNALQVLNDAIAQCSSALASVAPTAAASSEAQSAAPISAPIGISVAPSSDPTAYPINSSSPSVTSP